MFDKMTERVRRRLEQRARKRALDLAERLRAQLPKDIVIEADGPSVRLSATSIKSRFALEPKLRWMRLK